MATKKMSPRGPYKKLDNILQLETVLKAISVPDTTIRKFYHDIQYDHLNRVKQPRYNFDPIRRTIQLSMDGKPQGHIGIEVSFSQGDYYNTTITVYYASVPESYKKTLEEVLNVVTSSK